MIEIIVIQLTIGILIIYIAYRLTKKFTNFDKWKERQRDKRLLRKAIQAMKNPSDDVIEKIMRCHLALW